MLSGWGGNRDTFVKPSDAIALHRTAIRWVVEAHRARNARVFGSVLRGQDTDDSDLDILVDPTSETTLFDIGAIRHQIRARSPSVRAGLLTFAMLARRN